MKAEIFAGLPAICRQKITYNLRTSEIHRVISIVSGVFKIDPGLILGKTKKREISFPRQLICKILREKGYHVKRIGSFLNRDHSAITLAEKFIDGQLDIKDKKTIFYYEQCKMIIDHG